ncbi:hypothetical protein ACN38_g8702 [Penicillium nordicum]|uniref:Uncharacterized protein n=1 Tax=Penicillium nordicum TaxID=229535 RepID=A0A0M8NWT3_9EURO|nr:hypothetical protein ACN38_g8702 [Penicillium nordicum]
MTSEFGLMQIKVFNPMGAQSDQPQSSPSSPPSPLRREGPCGDKNDEGPRYSLTLVRPTLRYAYCRPGLRFPLTRNRKILGKRKKKKKKEKKKKNSHSC